LGKIGRKKLIREKKRRIGDEIHLLGASEGGSFIGRTQRSARGSGAKEEAWLRGGKEPKKSHSGRVEFTLTVLPKLNKPTRREQKKKGV